MENEENTEKAEGHSHEEHHSQKEHKAHKEHSEHSSHKAHSKKKFEFNLKKKAVWQAATAVLAVLLIISISSRGGSCATGAVTSEEAGEKTVEFINKFLTNGQTQVELKEVSSTNSMYMVNFEVQGQTYPSYVSMDGKLLFLQVIDMEKVATEAESGAAQEAQPSEVTKAEKPKVEVFVMSHCPYGTQIEKGILPVAELLGNKIDFSVKFVYYAMHGKTEIDEQLAQHCIQEEFGTSQYLKYLSCFLKEGDGAGCIDEMGLNQAQIEACVSLTDAEFGVTEKFGDQSTWLSGRYPLFDVDKELNTKYGVGGSPTLVINGASANAGRDAASLLKAVCDSFITQPEECNTELSSAQPSPGFGYEGTGTGAEGSCG